MKLKYKISLYDELNFDSCKIK